MKKSNKELVMELRKWLRGIIYDGGTNYISAPRGNDLLAVLDDYIQIQDELDGLRAFKRSVDKALNSGDGSYRP